MINRSSAARCQALKWYVCVTLQGSRRLDHFRMNDGEVLLLFNGEKLGTGYMEAHPFFRELSFS